MPVSIMEMQIRVAYKLSDSHDKLENHQSIWAKII